MAVENRIAGTSRQVTIETMDRHAKTTALLFAIYMNENACRIGPDSWQIRHTQWREQHTTTEVYDIFVQELTVENKTPD
jgi:hypothetical protein